MNILKRSYSAINEIQNGSNEPISKRRKLDPNSIELKQNSPIHNIPEEILCKIFSYVDKASLVDTPEVSKLWKKVSYSDSLYQQLLKEIAFFSEDWETYPGVTPGGAKFFDLTSDQVPRWVLASETPERHAITWIPQKINKVIITENGTEETQCSYLDTAEEVGELAANPKKGVATTFHPASPPLALKATWKEEESHWEWIDFRPKDADLSYSAQEAEVAKKGNGAMVASRRASLISLMMKKMKFNTNCFDWIKDGIFVRFKDKALINGKEWRIAASFFGPSLNNLTLLNSISTDSAQYSTVAVTHKFFKPIIKAS